MKIFLKKSLCFIFVGLFSTLAIFFTINYLYNARITKLTFDKNISTLICGDSHPMSSLDDKVISNSVNICLSSECYYYTYYKLRKILNNDNNIKYILLGMSFHSFEKNYDKQIFETKKIKEMYPIYFLILENSEKVYLVKKNPTGFLGSIPYIIKEAIITFLKPNEYNNYPFWGYYRISENTNLSNANIKAAIERHYHDTDSGLLQDFSDIQLEYLMKILNICTKKNIQLYLANTPISNEYFSKIPEKFINHYYNITKKLEFSKNVKILDYHNYQLPQNCYGDADHLNSNGAKIISEEIISEINDF